MSFNVDFYPELSEQGKVEAQKIVDSFKDQLKKTADDVIGNLYSDIVPWIESDAWTNMRNQLLHALCDYSTAKEYDKSSWHKIRAKIFEEHRDEITNDIIKDLLKEIEELKERLNMRFY